MYAHFIKETKAKYLYVQPIFQLITVQTLIIILLECIAIDSIKWNAFTMTGQWLVDHKCMWVLVFVHSTQIWPVWTGEELKHKKKHDK